MELHPLCFHTRLSTIRHHGMTPQTYFIVSLQFSSYCTKKKEKNKEERLVLGTNNCWGYSVGTGEAATKACTKALGRRV